jgi:hypothetical protein
MMYSRPVHRGQPEPINAPCPLVVSATDARDQVRVAESFGCGDTFGWFESWTGASLTDSGTTDRHQQEPGQVDRLWIIDVEDRRLVIDASYWPGATDQDRANLQRVVDSIAFER